MKEKTRQVIADMTDEIRRLRAMVSSRDGLIDASEAGWRTTEANRAAMSARVDELEEEKTLLTDMNGRLSTSVRDAIRARDKAVSDTAMLREDVRTLERRNLQLTREREEARSQVRQLATANRDLSEQCESLEAKRAELADQLLRLRTVPAVSGPSSALVENHNVLRRRLETARRDIERLERENVELRQAQDAVLAKNELIAEGIDERIKEAETLAGLVGQLRDAIFAAAADLDMVSVEEGAPSMLEVVAALGEAVQQGRETDDEANKLALLVALLLSRLDECGYGGPQAFSADEAAGAVGKTISAEQSPIDGRVVVALKDEVTS